MLQAPNDMPLPHLPIVSYLQTSPLAVQHVKASRLPIPRSMADQGLAAGAAAAAQSKHSRRRSLIPTPASGSSRKASPTLAVRNKPLPRLPRSDSLLPYTQRAEGDVSGVREQLNVRNFSMRSLDHPGEITAPVKTARPSLPKSKTSVSLAFHHPRRQTIPERSLLKPIHPSLPHSQSTGNVSCFSNPGITPSPSKVPPVPVKFDPQEDAEVTAMDAILESRMTPREIEVLNQVEKEALMNKNRFKSRYTSGVTLVQTQSSGSFGSSLPPSSSKGCVKQLEDTPRSSRDTAKRLPLVNGKPLTVDTQLANAATIRPVVGTDGATPSDMTDPRHVYFAQDRAYWTGRYVAICDRLRTQAMANALRPKPASANTRLSEYGCYENAENHRTLVALKELRGYCKTGKALYSFDEFEDQLRQALKEAFTALPRSPSEQGSDDDLLTMEANRDISLHAKHRELGKGMPNQSSTHLPRWPRPEIPLPSILGRLTKSKTTGDMTSMVPPLMSAKPIDANPKAKPASRPIIVVHHRRKSSATTSSLPSTMSLDENIPPVPMNQSTPGQVVINEPSSSDARSYPDSNARLPQHPSACHRKTSSFGSDQIFESTGSNQAYNPEGGQPAAPVKCSEATIHQDRDEKGRRPRFHRHRRSSGDVMKEIWQAGVGQVRKMGRRVGGTSAWMSSSEDFHAVMSPTSVHHKY